MIHSLRNMHGKKWGMILKIDLENTSYRLKCGFMQDTLQDDYKFHDRQKWSALQALHFDYCGMMSLHRGWGPHITIYLCFLFGANGSWYTKGNRSRTMETSKSISWCFYDLMLIFFADDQLFFEKASSTQVNIIKACLLDFSKASNQKINYSKSQIFF